MSRTQVYEFIAAEKTAYPVRLLCRLLGVGHSAFYHWLRAGRQRAADRQQHDQHRAAIARQAWVEHRDSRIATCCPRYGLPRQRWNVEPARAG